MQEIIPCPPSRPIAPTQTGSLLDLPFAGEVPCWELPARASRLTPPAAVGVGGLRVPGLAPDQDLEDSVAKIQKYMELPQLLRFCLERETNEASLFFTFRRKKRCLLHKDLQLLPNDHVNPPSSSRGDMLFLRATMVLLGWLGVHGLAAFKGQWAPTSYMGFALQS